MAKDFQIKTTFRAVDKSTRIIGKIQGKVMRFTAKASMGMRKLSRAVSKVSGAVTRGLKYGFATATVAATGLFMAINRTAQSMDALAKKARAIEFPIEEYQEWSFVANQSGLDTAKFDKGLNTFTKRIGKLRGGFGPLQTALKKTNKPLAKVLAGTTDSAQAMDIMIEAIQGAKTAADKSMLADAAFGVTNFALIAGNSTDQLKKLRAEMRENGIVTAEQAAHAEAYNDMMTRLKMTISGIMVDVLTPLMPMLTEWADWVRKISVENKGLISSKLKNGLSWLVDNFDKILYYGKRIGIALGVFYGLAAAVKIASTAMTIFNAIVAMNPIGLIVIATVAAVAAIYIFRKELIQVTVGIIKKFQAMAAGVRAFFEDPKKYIIQAWKWIKVTAISIWESMWDKIKAVARFAWGNLKDYVGGVIDLFTGNWESAGEKFGRIWGRIKNVAIKALDAIMVVLGPILDGIGVAWKWHDKSVISANGGIGSAASFAGGGASAAAAAVLPKPIRPVVNVNNENKTSKEEVEVTIRDESGKAKVTKGNSKRLELVHTGAMP